MKKLLIFSLMLSSIIFIACSESTSPSKSNVSFISSLSSPTITPSVNKKQDEVMSDVTELKIKKIRILMNEIKVSLNNEDKKVKIGPAVYTVTPDSQLVEFANTELPVGNVNKVKFEFHRFSSSEIADYENNVIFKDFATNDRYSVIINGTKKVGGTEIDFEYKSKMTANLTYNFAPPLVIEESKLNIFVFKFHPELVFKKDGNIIDPDDSKNFNDIDNLLRDAIKINKQ